MQFDTAQSSWLNPLGQRRRCEGSASAGEYAEAPGLQYAPRYPQIAWFTVGASQGLTGSGAQKILPLWRPDKFL
jgi:hypothetical protein